MPHIYKAVYKSLEGEEPKNIKFDSELFFGFEDHMGPLFDIELQRELEKKVLPRTAKVHSFLKVEYDGFTMQDDHKSCIGHLLSAPAIDNRPKKKKESLSIPPLLSETSEREMDLEEEENMQMAEKVKREYYTTTVRIVLAVEDPELLASISSMLSPYPQYRVVGRARNVISMFNLLEELRPDVLVSHFFSPAMAGYDSLGYLVKHFPPFYILSIGEEMTRSRMRKFFIKGVLGTAFTQEEFHLALSKVSQGKIYYEKDKREEIEEEGLLVS